MKYLLSFVLMICLSLYSSVALAAELPGLAILYFNYDGQNQQLEILKKGLTQMLISHIQPSVDNVRLVERERLEEVWKELELNRSDKIDPTTAAKLGKMIGARYIVLGSYFDLMGSLRIDSRLINVETGEIIHSTGVNGLENDFFAIEKQIVDGLVPAIAKIEALKERPTSPKKYTPKKTNAVPKKEVEQPIKKTVVVPEETKTASTTTEEQPVKKVHTTTIMMYSRALDAKDQHKPEEAKQIASEIPKSELMLLDLDSLLQ